MDDRELLAKYRETGDLKYRNAFVERYLYIAAVLAKKFVGRGVEYDDLYQVASLALIKAVDRYDETKGILFSTFVTPTITGEIKNYFRDRSRLVHLPRGVAELRAAIKKCSEEFSAQNGRSPTARELSTLLKVSEEDIVCAAEAGGVVSLDNFSRNEDVNLYSVIPSERDDFERIDNREAVLAACRELNSRERELMRLRFKEELSQTETAKRMRVSQMYVSRMERKILDKLREVLKKSMAE